jgi:uncharacterized membrane protein YvbJ
MKNVRVTLRCKCGSGVTVTREQANKDIRCSSCGENIFVPPEDVLSDMSLLQRAKTLRVISIVATALLILGLGVLTAVSKSEKNALVNELQEHFIPDQKAAMDRTLKHMRAKWIDEEIKDIMRAEWLGYIHYLEDLAEKEDLSDPDVQDLKERIEKVPEDSRSELAAQWLSALETYGRTQRLQYYITPLVVLGTVSSVVLSIVVSGKKHRIKGFNRHKY